jgi:osmoprotectant transport system substrate-binding protein
VLEDDRRFFPPYEAALMVRRDALSRHPSLEARLRALSYSIDDKEMRKMNADVDSGRRSVAEVAREFLAEHPPEAGP